MGMVWVLGLLLVGVVVWLDRVRRENRAIKARYLPLVNVDAAVVAATAELERARKEVQNEVATVRKRAEAAAAEVDRDAALARKRTEEAGQEALRQLQQAHDVARQEIAAAERRGVELKAVHAEAVALHDALKVEIGLLEAEQEVVASGLYNPTFSFDRSETYREELERIRDKQKTLIKEKRATYCSVPWKVGDSEKEGQKMVKQYSQLLLRAFNGESDAAIAKVSWNNAEQMRDRMKKAYEAINKLGEVMSITIMSNYAELKFAELRLEYEYEQKRRDEQEEQREIKARMKEEERAQKELDRAREKAEEEETRSEKALDKARAEMTKASENDLEKINLLQEKVRVLELKATTETSGQARLTEALERARVEMDRAKALELEKLNAAQAKIHQLEQEAEEARQAKERAISRAQQTRSGHVYIISNMGSFGENVFKIGMTRRDDPMERVKELGDASVPFDFDVHAMIFCEDAPTLENSLHRHFGEHRLNLVNERKEFFTVTIDAIDTFVKAGGHKVELTKLAAARDYRETLARREAKKMGLGEPARKAAPSGTVSVVSQSIRVAGGAGQG